MRPARRAAAPAGDRGRILSVVQARDPQAPRAGFARSESHARSIAKAVSWRATGSLDTFILALLITGSSAWAGSIAVTEIVTKIVAYYLHERVWSWVRWGRQ